jgi:hypothetical protein
MATDKEEKVASSKVDRAEKESRGKREPQRELTKPSGVDEFYKVPDALDWYEAGALINYWAVRFNDTITEEGPINRKAYRTCVRQAIRTKFGIGKGKNEFSEWLARKMVEFLIYLHFEESGEWYVELRENPPFYEHQKTEPSRVTGQPRWWRGWTKPKGRRTGQSS